MDHVTKGETYYWLPDDVELPGGSKEQIKAWVRALPHPTEVLVVDLALDDSVTYYWLNGGSMGCYVPFNVAEQQIIPYPIKNRTGWYPMGRPTFFRIKLSEFVEVFQEIA